MVVYGFLDEPDVRPERRRYLYLFISHILALLLTHYQRSSARVPDNGLRIIVVPVPAPVQEPPLELLDHPTRDQRLWQSDDPRYARAGGGSTPAPLLTPLAHPSFRDSRGGLRARPVIGSSGHGGDQGVHARGTGEMRL